VALTALTYTVTFNVADADANALEGAVVTLAGYGLGTSGADGSAVFADVVPTDNMVYSVTLSGYDDVIDVVSVTDTDVSVDVTLTAKPYSVTLSVVDDESAAVEGATLSIAGMDDQTTDASGNVSLSGLVGSVSYTVSKDGYDDATGELTYADKDQTVTVTLTMIIGFDNNEYGSIDIYPNPSADYVNLQLNVEQGSVSVYNITGKQVIDQVISSDLVRLNFADLGSGTYFMKVQNVEGSLIGYKKVIIQK